MTGDGQATAAGRPAGAGEFAGLAAVITGGASGIGLATATLLAERGARVACLNLNPRQVPEPLLGLAADVADDASVRAAITTAHETFGGLDILVNNAAIGAVGTIEADTDDDWHRVFDVNVVGIVRVSRAALPYLRASAHAAIVNIGSIAAWLGLPQRALYSASKGAVQALTLAMAADHVAAGIRVNCVNPGTADTPWVRRLLDAADDPAAELAALRARQPTGRLTTPQEVAAAVAYLASPLSGSTTGSVLAVDGGMHGLRLPTPPSRA
ncbi:SDR family NAD(P)-dependent oxidoreductase [Verrucosispora sp. WMMA2044]|uniref:SDR family NAD(P)-dependent oxidoreductase n=1 Tax=Verrucosispora sp. WMMA2044 TaxID=3016419 RepID=UPI00248B6AB5|nr:SDR family oxidoreductase [Verrucosispora sp. WMMA2044]WBB51170.1 SDR family NAD(P)-dependent oxidoreductase [Verrucosispora sp. WMMA2044]